MRSTSRMRKLCGIFSSENYRQAYTNSPTLPIMVAVFSSDESLFLAKVSALAAVIILVPVALGIYTQKHLVHGLTGGAIK